MHFARLLRARRERPRDCCAAEQRDEVAAFHCPMPPVLRTERIAHLGTAGGAALRDFDPAYDRSGSESVIRWCLLNVRIAPESRPQRGMWGVHQ